MYFFGAPKSRKGGKTVKLLQKTSICAIIHSCKEVEHEGSSIYSIYPRRHRHDLADIYFAEQGVFDIFVAYNDDTDTTR